VEPNRKTSGGHPAGLDYIKYLGVTHVQIQPILDFNSIDDKNTKNWYNWGYDPISYFALEGSYSIHPEDAYSRLDEFRTMVDELHKNDLRLVVDVVYNHMYKYEERSLEKLVPHYYFRKRRNGLIANASGCGNDVASERKMVRKLIVDSVKYLFTHFDIDGLRFDLMGLMDIETIDECFKAAKVVKKDVMFYGEGWEMGEELPPETRANKSNSALQPNYAFFNDSYRDIIKGPSSPFNLHEKGFICGNVDYKYGVDFAFHACVLDLSYKSFLMSANQSINYLECHDNNTLYDKLLVSNKEEEEKTLLDRVTLANSILLLSFGIPFIHMGQEIGLSKEGEDNTYNMGDKYNKMSYDLLDERFAMSCYLKDALKARKKLDIFALINPKQIEKAFDYKKGERGSFTLTNNIKIDGFKKVIICVNPDLNSQNIALDDYYEIYFGNAGIVNNKSIHVKNIMQPPLNVDVLVKKEK
jgi:pullulanase